MKFIGYSKVSIQNKITIIEQVATVLNLNIGDHVAFLESDGGDIIIKNLRDVEAK